jgi:carboxyl-terminal processing protease
VRRLIPPVVLALLACGGAESVGGIHARMAFSESGLRVVDVPEEGPAHEAGLQEGDRIISVGGEPVRTLNMAEVVERLRGPIGSSVRLEIVRDGEIEEIEVRRAAYQR